MTMTMAHWTIAGLRRRPLATLLSAAGVDRPSVRVEELALALQ